PGHCYSNPDKRPYCRYAKRVHRKNFVGGVPGIKIRQFHMGMGDKTYSHAVHYVTTERKRIRDNALESIRQGITRQLNKKLTSSNYYMKMRLYPQFFLRENKQAKGAGADRVQKGMSHPFGKITGRASSVRKNQKILTILVEEANVRTVKDILIKQNSKLPTVMSVLIEKNLDNLKSVGTVKKKKKMLAEEKEEEAKVTEAKAASDAAKVADKAGTDSKAKTDSKDAKGKDSKAKDAKTDKKK
ncbi:MAG: 50S ribosomal protein L16, partial [archaeon]